MRRIHFFLFLAFLLFTLPGCGNVLYVSNMGWNQFSIAVKSLSVDKVLQDKGVNDGTKEKIRFIQEVKNFGEQKLHLTKTKNYSTFLETKGPILYVVVAAEKDRLKLYSWKFPIIGKVTYKSFFNKDDALKEQRKLDEQGYDTVVQPVEAYSTLGWFRDPVFSTMLRWNEVILANLILHETTHATVYFKGKTAFNEQLATFVGNQGAIQFLKEKYGPGSKEVAKADQIQKDDLLFSDWIDRVFHRLSDFYRQEIPREEKLKGREEIFRSIKEEFQKLKPELKTNSYDDFGRADLNNALLLAYHQYVQKLDQFQILYEKLGKDLGKMIEFFKKVKESDEDPVSALKEAVGNP